MNRLLLTVVAVFLAAQVSAFSIFSTKADRFYRNGEKSVIIWRTNGTMKVTKPCTVELLLVGGGGGGGGFANGALSSAGGGGAGGFVHKETFLLQPGDYDIAVGTGGEPNNNGGDTKITLGGEAVVTAYGGGAGGGAGGTTAPGNGASGGGASHPWDGNAPVAGGAAIHNADGETQGFDGMGATHVYGAGGGGGAGAAAPDDRCGYDGIYSYSQPGSGGDGLPCSITGREVWYAGGGAGSRMKFPVDDTPANNPCKGGMGGGGSVHTSGGDVLKCQGTDGLGGGGAGGYRGGSGVAIVSFVDDGTPDYTDDFAVTGDGVLFGSMDKAYYGRIYRRDGTLTVTGAGSVDILLVGGGGGGGSCDATYGGAGGGAGGFMYLTNVAVTAGTYAIKVGGGGAVAQNGGDSSALGIVAYGGGAGADANASVPAVGKPGGSGGGGRQGGGGNKIDGGAALNIESNVGHDGGSSSNIWAPGGGGGAGESGYGEDGSHLYAPVMMPGKGGDGLPCSITGPRRWYAGGGAGLRLGYVGTVPGGKGGGAASGGKGEDGLGGGGSGGQSGGSGIVVVRVNRLFDVKVDVGEDVATGGALTSGRRCNIHTFTQSGTFTTTKDIVVEVLAIGGGGGGGSFSAKEGGSGGGGAGGFVHHQGMLLGAGTYAVTIGAGGDIEQNGGDTTFAEIIAHGGGAGARMLNGTQAKDGASGGGATMTMAETTENPRTVLSRAGGKAIWSDDENEGHDGGVTVHVYGTAGGGGAGTAGPTGTNSSPVPGGEGLPCSISGREVWYAGGGAGYRWGMKTVVVKGGGGISSEDVDERKGTDGLGGGGAGNAAGGSGVVIIRYSCPRGMYIIFR